MHLHEGCKAVLTQFLTRQAGMIGPLQLKLDTPTHVHYGAAMRRDLQLLEIDDAVLAELQATG